MGDSSLHGTLTARFRVKGERASEVGEAFDATDAETGREGVLEVVGAIVAPDSAARSRLKSQLRRLAAATSERLLRPILTGDTGEALWIFREPEPGTSLEDRLAAGPLAAEEAERLILAVADALADLHRLGLVQRTLCPRNVRLVGEGVVLVDIGLDPILRGVGSGAITGVPGYVAPEHAEGKPWSARGDLYALGCVWIAMLTGEGPFEGESVDAALDGAATTDLAIPEGLDEPAASALRKLVKRDPRQRAASVRELYRLLGKAAPPEPAAGTITTSVALPRPAPASAPKTTSVPPPVPAPRGAADGRASYRPSSRPAPKPVRAGSLPPPPPRPTGAPTAPPASGPAARPSALPPPVPFPAAGKPKASWSVPPPVPPTRPAAGTGDAELPVPPTPRTRAAAPARNAADERTQEIALEALEADASARIVTPAADDPAAAGLAPLELPDFAAALLAEPPTAGPPSAAAAAEPALELPPIAAALAEPAPAPEATAAAPAPADEPEPPPAAPAKPERASRPPIGSVRELAARRASLRPKGSPSTPPPALEGADAERGADVTRADDAAAGANPALEPDALPPPPSLDIPDFMKAAPGAHGEPVAAHLRPEAPADGKASPALLTPEQRRRAVYALAAAAALLLVFLGVRALSRGEGEPELDAAVAAAGERSNVATTAIAAPPVTAAEPERPAAGTTGSGAPAADRAAAESDLGASETANAGDLGASETANAGDLGASETANAGAQSDVEVSETAGSPAEPGARASESAGSRANTAEAARSARPAAGALDAALAEARAHYRARRFRQAEAAYLRATRLGPSNAALHAGLGAARLAQGKSRPAVEAYRRATQLAPSNSGYFSALGRAYAGAGNRSAARAAYRKALQLNPNNASARSGLQAVGG